MDEGSELIRVLARIWQIHYRQEALYRSLMSMEISCRFRYFCGRAHLSSVLFRKEISHVYETCKCVLSDGELGAIIRTAEQWDLDNISQSNAILRLIPQKQNDLIVFYQTAVELLWEDAENAALCTDHLDQLRNTNHLLKVETELTRQSELHTETTGWQPSEEATARPGTAVMH